MFNHKRIYTPQPINTTQDTKPNPNPHRSSPPGYPPSPLRPPAGPPRGPSGPRTRGGPQSRAAGRCGRCPPGRRRSGPPALPAAYRCGWGIVGRRCTLQWWMGVGGVVSWCGGRVNGTWVGRDEKKPNTKGEQRRPHTPRRTNTHTPPTPVIVPRAKGVVHPGVGLVGLGEHGVEVEAGEVPVGLLDVVALGHLGLCVGGWGGGGQLTWADGAGEGNGRNKHVHTTTTTTEQASRASVVTSRPAAT